TRLDSPTSLPRELTRAAMDLADTFWNMSSPVRALTVPAIYLVPASEVGAQMDLFFPERELKRQRLERLEDKLDAIEAKYRRKNPSKTV
ncbi:MAG: DNA polymerase IV, partial [Lachnospiraceae bacterium]|nr:DNA polymerase IV [Lachnospiraceae bacterium]